MTELYRIQEEIEDITEAMQETAEMGATDKIHTYTLGRIIGRVEMLAKRMEAVEMWMGSVVNHGGEKDAEK